MLTRFWRATRDEDGQAIIIAAIGLLVVALVVLGTVTIGNAIHEKVRLQNAADAAAYSTAAVQARAFNFYAFTNRTMVSHYVAIMLLQSYLVVTTFIYSAINTVLSLVSTLGAPCSWGSAGCRAICTAISVIPIVGQFMAVVSQIMAAITSVLQPISDALKRILWGSQGSFGGLDRFIGWVAIPALVGANWILYIAQYAMMFGTSAAVLSGSRQTVDEGYRDTGREAPELGGNIVGTGLVAAHNFANWNRAHDSEAMNASPLMPHGTVWQTRDRVKPNMDDVDPGVKRAQRVMTEISNATRWNHFIFNRSLDNTFVGKALDTISRVTLGFFDLEVHGETKMLTESWPIHDVTSSLGFDRHDIRRSRFLAGHTHMPQGGSIVGDQWMKFDFFLGSYFDMTESRLHIGLAGWGLNRRFTPRARQSAIAATYKEASPRSRWGWHCSTQLRERRISLGLGCMPRIQTINSWASRCEAPEPNEASGGNHPWWGVTPFMKFNPSSDGSPGTDFHQPSTLAWLHQPPSNIDKDPFLKQTVLRLGAHQARIDTSVAEEGTLADVMGPGFHAIARGMAYYHRPGNWNEHPNFFNPFWRAKLEPMAPILEELANTIGVGELGEIFGNRLITR